MPLLILSNFIEFLSIFFFQPKKRRQPPSIRISCR